MSAQFLEAVQKASKKKVFVVSTLAPQTGKAEDSYVGEDGKQDLAVSVLLQINAMTVRKTTVVFVTENALRVCTESGLSVGKIAAVETSFNCTF